MSPGVQVLMMVVALIMLIKNFFFLRMRKQLSALVTMLTEVIHDVQAFMFFYAILILLTTVILSILDIGNF